MFELWAKLSIWSAFMSAAIRFRSLSCWAYCKACCSDVNCFWHIFWHSSDILSDILSDISCGILSDISSDILSDISSGTLSDSLSHGWGPAGNTGRGCSGLRSGREHWPQKIAVGCGREHWPQRFAVEARQGTLVVAARGWGPVGNTGRGCSLWLRRRRRGGEEKRGGGRGGAV